jgi:murein DD-endopeptidase MepM/ murein hydrolase activator NlpD
VETSAPTEPAPVDPAPAETPAPQTPTETATPEPVIPSPTPTPLAPQSTTKPDVRATSQTVIAPFPNGVNRLAGADRFETAIAVSKRFAPGIPVLYMSTATDFPDALTAAAAAAKGGGPLLLTYADVLPPAVKAEVQRLSPERIIVVGGEAIVGGAVFNELANLAPRISRLGGSDRYQTGEILALEAFNSSTEAFIATGRDFPDALAASAAAGARSAPVLLVDGLADTVRESTVRALRSLGVTSVRLAGGTGAVSAGIESSLRSFGFSTERYQGEDRYLTASAINTAVFGSNIRTVFFATGLEFPDALAGAALAGGMKTPLYITRVGCIPHPVHTALNAINPPARVILGGEGAVNSSVETNTACAAAWTKPANGRITDVYGPRTPICTPGGCSNSFHYGTDIGTGCWSPIYAAAGGRVTHASWLGTYGNYIKISHGSSIDTGYAHLVNGGYLVKVGDVVSTGQQIGWSGTTGASTGCHLHFEVFSSGLRIDPQPFMLQRGVRLG